MLEGDRAGLENGPLDAALGVRPGAELPPWLRRHGAAVADADPAPHQRLEREPAGELPRARQPLDGDEHPVGSAGEQADLARQLARAPERLEELQNVAAKSLGPVVGRRV